MRTARVARLPSQLGQPRKIPTTPINLGSYRGLSDVRLRSTSPLSLGSTWCRSVANAVPIRSRFGVDPGRTWDRPVLSIQGACPRTARGAQGPLSGQGVVRHRSAAAHPIRERDRARARAWGAGPPRERAYAGAARRCRAAVRRRLRSSPKALQGAARGPWTAHRTPHDKTALRACGTKERGARSRRRLEPCRLGGGLSGGRARAKRARGQRARAAFERGRRGYVPARPRARSARARSALAHWRRALRA